MTGITYPGLVPSMAGALMKMRSWKCDCGPSCKTTAMTESPVGASSRSLVVNGWFDMCTSLVENTCLTIGWESGTCRKYDRHHRVRPVLLTLRHFRRSNSCGPGKRIPRGSAFEQERKVLHVQVSLNTQCQSQLCNAN